MLSTLELTNKQRAFQLGKCSDCRSDELVTDRESGEIVCSICGLVIKDLILDQKPEWRAFTPEEKKVKTISGSPTSLLKFDKGLSTTFQPYRDTYGHFLPVKERVKMLRLRKWHLRASRHSSILRNLSRHERPLTTFRQLQIPLNVEEQAAFIYRKALDKGLVRGRSILAIAAASLYAACRVTRTPRSLQEVVKVSTRTRKEIARNYRLIQRELDLTMPIDTPRQYISQIASKTKLSQKTQNVAIELIHEAKTKNDVVGKGPQGMAAAALYIASILRGEKMTQQALAEAAGVTEVTVRNRYKGLDRSLGLGLRTEG
jgi:transcription initiation factor TFIIB